MGSVRPRAAVIATIGVLAIAASAYFNWTTVGNAELVPLRRLLFVGDVSADAPSYWLSMAAPLAVIGGIGVVGALLLSRVVLLIAFLLGTATATLWVVAEVLDTDAGAFGINRIELGGWVLLGGLIVTLIGLIALRTVGEDEEDDEIEPFAPLPSAYTGDPTRIGPGASPLDSEPGLGGSSSTTGSSSPLDSR